ncbi:hypothetical protein RRG08_037630 [Elysia crispata]|uniref:Uncharacterized protein n=1 Tax=Elysia crispata TaxID=231223 RepID=A0AAE0YHD1_9GAST|nr:hypothetical protein RRG08_037630 [Elysia crispata]
MEEQRFIPQNNLFMEKTGLLRAAAELRLPVHVVEEMLVVDDVIPGIVRCLMPILESGPGDQTSPRRRYFVFTRLPGLPDYRIPNSPLARTIVDDEAPHKGQLKFAVLSTISTASRDKCHGTVN